MTIKARGNKQQLLESRINSFFSVYFMMGPQRSLIGLRKLLAEMGIKVSRQTLGRYSSEFGWQEKLKEQNARVKERIDERSIDVVAKMNENQANLGRALQTISAAKLTQLQGRMGEVSPSDATGMAREGVKIERLALGQATDRREMAILVFNVYIEKMCALFEEVNVINDPGERARAFAAGGDAIAADALKGVEP